MICIPQLESLIISTAIPDLKSANFWKTHFSDHIIVDWKSFIHHLVNDLNLYNTKSDFSQLLSTGNVQDSKLLRIIKCLKFILATKENTTEQKEIVKIETFGWLVSWLGSLQTNFLDNMLNLIDKAWFHGDISARVAEYQLKNKPLGTFLVRFSTASFGSYTLSYVTTPTIINHLRFSYSSQSNIFESGNTEYLSINQLITSKTQLLGLSLPCLGSKYVVLEQEDNFGYDSVLSNKKLK